MPTISITQGLAEIKLLGKRIDAALEGTEWIAVATKSHPVDADRLKTKAQAAEQSYTALVKRRQILKAAIVKSNAETIVRIGPTEMSVAEAIERKTSIAYQQRLLDSMRSAHYSATQTYRSEQEQVQARLDRLLATELGKDVRTNPETIAALTSTFKETNKVDLVDPLHLADRIKALEEEVETFTTNVDWVLAESNGRTMIEVPA